MTNKAPAPGLAVRAGNTADTSAAADPIARRTSAELLGARGEMVIEHDGREYRLRLTQNGKLILTA